MNNKRLFFSLEGVDINDDDALAAFTQHVWEQATAAIAEVSINGYVDRCMCADLLSCQLRVPVLIAGRLKSARATSSATSSAPRTGARSARVLVRTSTRPRATGGMRLGPPYVLLSPRPCTTTRTRRRRRTLHHALRGHRAPSGPLHLPELG